MRPDWEDMSPFAVHFTTPDRRPPSNEPLPDSFWARIGELARRARAEDTTGYHNVMSILGGGFIQPFADPHGAASHIPGLADQHRSAALSEIPLHLLDRLVNNRSAYGVGFRLEFLVLSGGARVWYLEDGGPVANAVQESVKQRASEGVNPDDPYWTATPFIDFPDPTREVLDYRWEREWRVPGGLRFHPDDVAFLFIPEEFHERARQFFVDAREGNTGPAYLCPYIDPGWEQERVLTALESEPHNPDPSPDVGYDPSDDIGRDLSRGR